MKPNRNDAKWSGLCPENLATLEKWLFEDNLTYDEALAKAKTELGFRGSRASLQRFYRIKARERLLMDMEESAAHVSEIASAPGTEGTLRNSGMKLLARKFLDLVLENGKDEMMAVAKLLLLSEANENHRQDNEIKREAVELRKRRLDFELTAWQYNTVEQCFKYLPELNARLKERDEATDVYSENKRMNAIRRRLFGQDIPEPAPENDEEALALKNAKDKWGHLWLDAYEDSLRRIKLRKQYGTPDEPEAAAPATIQTAMPEEPPKPSLVPVATETEKTSPETVPLATSCPKVEQTANTPLSPVRAEIQNTGPKSGSPLIPSARCPAVEQPPSQSWEDHEPANRLPFNRPSTAVELSDKIHRSK